MAQLPRVAPHVAAARPPGAKPAAPFDLIVLNLSKDDATSSKTDESPLLQQHQAAASSGSSSQGSVAVADDVEEGEGDDEGDTFGDLPPPSPDFRATIASAEQQSMSNELSPMQKLMSGLGQLSTRMGSYFSPAEVEQELPTRISIPANRSPQRLQVAQDLKPKFDGTLVPVRV
jgi:hypothetical protein